MNKVVEYIIGAKDATAGAIRSALSRLRSFASSVGSNLQNIRAGFGMLRTAITNAMVFIEKTFAFEKMTVQFKSLVGSMDEARAHMQMLQELGNTPPFSLEEFAAASRSMMVMTEGVLGFKKSLELVGDVAAATGQPIQNLAHEVGRAFAIIRDGQPLTRATMGLRNMGAITPEVAAKLDELQKAGASTSEIWNTLEEHLKRFEGAMKETEETGDGLMGAIKSQWDTSVRTFGEEFKDAAKEGLGLLLEKLKQLNENGSIESWARAAVGSLETVAGWLVKVVSLVGEVWDHLSEGRQAWKEIKSEQSEHAQEEAFTFVREEQINPYTKKRYYEGENGSERIEEIVDEAARKQYEREQREAAAAQKAAEEEARKQEALAEGQRKLEEKKAKEKLDYQKKLAADIEAAQIDAEEKAALAALNAADKIAQKRAQIAQDYADALLSATTKEEKAAIDAANTVATKRLNMEKNIADEVARIRKEKLSKDEDALQKELAEWKEASADAKTRLSNAEQAEKQAWGWYRDRDSWTKQLEEERADAEAQKQFDKDFAKLKNRFRDWRTSDRLSDDDELIRRVALAREEKAAAEEYAKQTAEATQACADALEAIQSAIAEEG